MKRRFNEIYLTSLLCQFFASKYFETVRQNGPAATKKWFFWIHNFQSNEWCGSCRSWSAMHPVSVNFIKSAFWLEIAHAMCCSRIDSTLLFQASDFLNWKIVFFFVAISIDLDNPLCNLHFLILLEFIKTKQWKRFEEARKNKIGPHYI